jgi:hypothetical protein
VADSFVRRYYTHEAASDCVNYISGLKLDDRPIRADWDTGFEEGRQVCRSCLTSTLYYAERTYTYY